MEQEEANNIWYFINWSQKDPWLDAAHIIHQKNKEDRTCEESTSKYETNNFIFEENWYRFQLANSTPISSTKLIEQLGYLADSDIAK